MILFDLQDNNRVDMLVASGAVVNIGTEVDLSEYYTKTETDEAISTAVEKIELLPGPAGPRGEKGERGPSGADGYTPQKGVDYWTDTDKQEIVDEVLSTLPTAEGGKF